MKIDAQLRSTFEYQRRRADALRVRVDTEILNTKDARWHYESRVKKLESFALKAESGKAKDPDQMEDIFACVIVVPNFSDIETVEHYVRSRYDFAYKRPEFSDSTKKEPFDFRFDDLRMFVRYSDSETEPPSGLSGFLFEVQVRTFLQHAWSVATHDVVYKSSTLSWRRERIANQVKATLEQAEVTIENMLALEKSDALPKSNARYDSINGIADVLRENWTEEQLPADVRRLAEAVEGLLNSVWPTHLTEDFRIMLRDGRRTYGGEHNLDWSPYRAILNYVADLHPTFVSAYLKADRTNGSIFMYPEVLTQIGLAIGEAPGAILLAGSAES